MKKRKRRRTGEGATSGGVPATEKLINELAAEAESGYEPERLRRRGRPPLGAGPSEIVPVRFDPELRRALEERAAQDETTQSALIRKALRTFLGTNSERKRDDARGAGKRRAAMAEDNVPGASAEMSSVASSDRTESPTRVAPSFSTGGGGFLFEDLVGGWAGAALLSGASPFGSELASLTSVRFQAQAIGHPLDDLVVTGAVPRLPVLSASVKSFDMLTGGKLMQEFVDAAWQQLLSEGFREETDHVGLVCERAAEGNFVALQQLIADARADTDEGLAQRIQVEGAFNATHRSLWKSAQCPADLAAAHAIDVDSSPARLLRHLLPRRLDLLAPGSQTQAQARTWCREALVPEQAHRADELWEALCSHIGEVRPAAGSLTWHSLLRQFAGRFIFRMRPDVAPDWELLARSTSSMLSTVRDQMGDDLHLERRDAWQELETGDDAPLVVLTGPSGAGKTALGKRWVQTEEGEALWLDANDLREGLRAFGVRLGLRLDVLQVVRMAPRPVRVLVDGLDRTYESAPLQAMALLAKEAASSNGQLRVLITCQQFELARITSALVEANAPPAKIAAIGDLDDGDVAQVVSTYPDLTRVVVGGQLVGVLRRPKLLDLVLRASTAVEALPRITDETDVARLWWDHFVRRGAAASARAELVLHLAEEQADRLAAATPAGELGVPQAAQVDALRLDGVLNPSRHHYGFEHDLFGDWSRLQRLEALGDGAIEWLIGKEQLPPWHRAIRLFGLARLRSGGTPQWNGDRVTLESRQQPLLADLFLDAVLFAHDSAALLEHLWPTLVDEKGELLRRLLRRFLSVATYPDPRGPLIFADRPELLAHWSAQNRIPVWALWLPAIEVLDAHREQALELAPKQIAAVADMWLRNSEQGWPMRLEAAGLGLAAGQFVIQRTTEGWHFDDELAEALYRAALAAGAELPDQVTTLLTDALTPRDTEEQEEPRRAPGGAFTGFNRVDRTELRQAILNDNALLPLVAADARRAAELLTLAIIERDASPHFGAFFGEPSPEITDAPRWFAPLPERGPFLAFLNFAPEEALRCILGIVEHATAAWEVANAPSSPAYEVLRDGKVVHLIGDAEVMHWHRGEGRAPSVLTSALMAIEAWLYRRLDAEEDVSDALVVLVESRSVAVWGLLTEVAVYRPELLRSALRPLITGADLLRADSIYRHQPHNYLLMPMLGEQAWFERVRAWHTMPHRSTNVMQVLMGDVLLGGALVDELALARKHWQETDGERLKHLIAQTDPANYRATRLESGAIGWLYEPPEEFRGEIAESTADMSATEFWLGLPHRFREWIDAGNSFDDVALEQLWTNFHERLVATPDSMAVADILSEGVRSRADLECGLAAFLVVCAPQWLDTHEDRAAWCRAALLAPFAAPPPTHAFDFRGDVSTERWDMFCADAVPRLWQAAPDDRQLRAAVVRLATNVHHNTVGRFFSNVASVPSLSDELKQLETVALHWARFLAWRQEREHRLQYADYASAEAPSVEELPDVETPTRRALEEFEAGTLPAHVPGLREWLHTTPEGMAGSGRLDPRRRALSLVDPEYFLVAFTHVLTLEDTRDPSERERRLTFAVDLANWLGGAITPRQGEQQIDGTPYPFERGAYALLAQLTLSVAPDEARSIWQPLLEPGGPSGYWVEDYLGEIWRGALAREEPPTLFAALVKEMIAFASEASSWKRAPHSTDIALAIVGLDRWGMSRAEGRHAQLFETLQPEWGQWVSERLGGSWYARQAVQFFGEEAADRIHEQAIDWLAERERQVKHGDADLDGALAEMLVNLRARHPTLFSGEGTTPSNARFVLSRVAARGNTLALQLMSELG